jgi:hypothetical protein
MYDDTLRQLEIPAFLRRQAPRKSSQPYDPSFIPEEEPAGDSSEKPSRTEEQHGNKALIAFLTELNTTGGSVLSRALLEKHGIAIGTDSNSSFDLQQAIRQLHVLETAFQEASEYDPIRHHNQPPPALWVGKAEYIADLKELLSELRLLNDRLKTEKLDKPKGMEGSASVAVVAGKKFVESYADVMGKGAAALTIGGIATLFISLGVDKGSVEAVWNLLRPSK